MITRRAAMSIENTPRGADDRFSSSASSKYYNLSVSSRAATARGVGFQPATPGVRAGVLRGCGCAALRDEPSSFVVLRWQACPANRAAGNSISAKALMRLPTTD